MSVGRKILSAVGLVLLVAAISAGIAAHRVYRVYNIASDFRAQIRYLIETGETIGEAPASETFSTDFLEAIFGDNPELLAKLKAVVHKGLADEPALNLGEVTSMIVTYHKGADDKVEDVVAHAVGGFPLGKMRPGFHRDGYFSKQIDRNLWNLGNSVIGFLGRDMVLFSEESTAKSQQELLESIFSGDITLLVQSLEKPLYFTAVFPDPKRIVPPQLKSHVQAVVVKGSLAYTNGTMETIILCPSEKSATYAFGIINDMKRMAVIGLKTRWGGAVFPTEWGPMVGAWWAYEMVQTVNRATLSEENILVRLKTSFGRIMVNAFLKSVERMSRDLAQMKGSLEERLDPRIVDARLQSSKPLHYWSDPHQWGPNWPIPPGSNEVEELPIVELETNKTVTVSSNPS